MPATASNLNAPYKVSQFYEHLQRLPRERPCENCYKTSSVRTFIDNTLKCCMCWLSYSAWHDRIWQRKISLNMIIFVNSVSFSTRDAHGTKSQSMLTFLFDKCDPAETSVDPRNTAFPLYRPHICDFLYVKRMLAQNEWATPSTNNNSTKFAKNRRFLH